MYLLYQDKHTIITADNIGPCYQTCNIKLKEDDIQHWIFQNEVAAIKILVVSASTGMEGTKGTWKQ
jgi:hypothetical protein